VEWWIMHLFSFESPSLELNFCYLSINLCCGSFQGRAQTSLHPSFERILHFIQSAFFHCCCFSSWSILLVRKPCRCSTSLIHRGVSPTFAPLSKPESLGFTPDRITWGSLGGDQSPLLPLEAGLNSNSGSYQSDKWCSLHIADSCTS
jgi:hypothetical protein